MNSNGPGYPYGFKENHPYCSDKSLVGGLEHEFYVSIYWESSSKLTFIFFRGVETTNQIIMINLPHSILEPIETHDSNSSWISHSIH